MSSNKVITCKAPICWGPKLGQTIEEIQVEPAKAREVRVKIVANGVCRSDAHHLDGDSCDVDLKYPNILGHEGSGIVESVGEGVKSVVPGDHVILLFMPNCQENQQCEFCSNNKTNMCQLDNFNTTTSMRDQTSRFSHKGKTIYHYCGVSTFSEYTVVREDQVAKIDPAAPLEKVCLIGCCVATGYGNALNVAKVTPGSSCAIWGLGAIGLCTALGCFNSGAKRIIAVDTNPDKFQLAKKFGVTEFVDPRQLAIPIDKYFQQQGGLDYTFECVGGNQMVTLEAAFNSLAPWGTCVFAGVTKAHQPLSIFPNKFLDGRSIRGATFGAYKSRSGVSQLIQLYMEGKLSAIDNLITGYFKLEDIPKCFDLLRQGKACRSIILYD